MDYRSKLLEFMYEDQQEEIMDWIRKHSTIEQLIILDELQQLLQEVVEETGDEEVEQNLKNLEEFIAKYQELVMNEQMAILRYEVARQDADKAVDQALAMIQKVRDHLIQDLINQSPNAANAQKIIDDLIRKEKENDYYDPENWKGLPGL